MSSPDGTRERILNAARRLIESDGAGGVRIEDIAKAAGVSRQAVYLHFSNRTNLLVEMARHIDREESLAERVVPYRTAATAHEALRLWVDFWANYIPVIYPAARALLAVRGNDAAAATAWDDRMAALRQGCGVVVDRLGDEGILHARWTREQAVDLLFGTVSLRSWELFTRECGWSQDDYVAAMKVVLERSLLVD